MFGCKNFAEWKKINGDRTPALQAFSTPKKKKQSLGNKIITAKCNMQASQDMADFPNEAYWYGELCRLETIKLRRKSKQ